MKPLVRVAGVFTLAVFLLAAVWGALAATAAEAANSGEPPVGGFIADGSSVNMTGTNAQTPALAIPDGQDEPWVAFVQNNRVLVSKFVSATSQWVQQDGALNRSLANAAQDPALAFGGTNGDIAWAAWSETVSPTSQVNAAWFNDAAWELTPVLNRNPGQNANSPALVIRRGPSGRGSGTEALPWVVWSEDASGGTRQIVTSRAVADGVAQGGYSWQAVGDPIKFDAARDAITPDLVFADAGQATPWIVWQEAGGDKPARIFAARLVSDTWQTIGRQENCGNNELACTLNLNPQHNAQSPQLAAGQLSDGAMPIPWVIFTEENPNGADMRVMRLDVGDLNDANDDRFIPVGGSVNQQCLSQSQLPIQGGGQPDLYFVGNVPHVAWVERVSGIDHLFVCHLADARPGQERWDLDSIGGLNRTLGEAVVAPSLGANGTTPYVAWQEDRDAGDILVAHRYPDGPAWGRNYPPFIRTISPSHNFAAGFSAMPAAFTEAIAASIAADSKIAESTGPVTITTTCYHAEGWEHIQEIHFALADENQTIFFARYVASENKVYVQDPDNPGVFFPGITPGPGSPPIPTRFVTLITSQMSVESHGGGSSALDINWVLLFTDETLLQHYTQSLNILYDGGQATDLFQVGSLFVGQETFLPTIVK